MMSPGNSGALDRHVARNYAPLPVVVAEGQGAWVTDVDGRRYLDCLAAYSAVNFGHRHPALVAAAHAQLDRLTVVSRAFHNDRLGEFCAALAQLTGKDLVLPMNTGAEAIETALKVARKWGAEVKGVGPDRAKIVVAAGNFHGWTISIISFSDDPQARGGFGPFTPGFVSVPFGDAEALAAAVDEETVAVLLEPIQGEAGVVIPPEDYLPRARELCTQAGALLICDEIQSGLCRTGATFASGLWGVTPDVYVLGKALGGGIVPVSAVVADADVLGVIGPGQHGSTFGGNPLAAAIGSAVVALVETGEMQRRSRELGARLGAALDALVGRGLVAVRSRGLWAGIDVDPAVGSGRDVCLRLAELGVLAREAHGSTLRLAPPLVITESEVDFLINALAEAVARPAASRHVSEGAGRAG
jgi:ornithine--oxo-acid transaminase